MFHLLFFKECFGLFTPFIIDRGSYRSDRIRGRERGQHAAYNGIISLAAAKDFAFQYILFLLLSVGTLYGLLIFRYSEIKL